MRKFFVLALCAVILNGCTKKNEVNLMNVNDFNTEVDGKKVSLYTLKNGFLTMQVTNYGGRVVSLWMPDYKGSFEDIVLGYDKIDRYINCTGERYLGAVVGRCANRIANGEFTLDGKRCLAVHASLDDVFWKAVMPDNVRGDYKDFDIVFSGHSHYPHTFAKFYETCDPKRRNKHAALFVNPGSVGQPRNHDPQAQYAIFDSQTQSVMMRRVKYPVDKAMSLYDGSVDDFYRARLEYGV